MTKHKILTLRISEEDMDRYKRLARDHGIPLSALIRTFVNEGVSSFDPKHVQLVAKVEANSLHLASIRSGLEKMQEMLAVNTALTATSSTADFEKVAPLIAAAKELEDMVNEQFSPPVNKKGK